MERVWEPDERGERERWISPTDTERLKLTDGAVLHEDYLGGTIWWLQYSVHIFSREDPRISRETDVLGLTSWEHGTSGNGDVEL